MPENAAILSAVRTPIGAFQGSLSSLTASQLGSIAIQAAIDRSGIGSQVIDEVLMGCVLTGGQGQAPARQAALGAGLPTSVPCTTINKVCGSGMKSVMMATQSILLGDAKFVIAGGMESMSNAPYVLEKARSGYRMGNGVLIDSMIHDGLWDPYHNVHMGNRGDATAKEFDIARERLDEFSAESYRRALAAQADGKFRQEIVGVPVPQRKGDPVLVDQDEEPGKGNPAKLPELRPAFAKDGVTTAGNASSLDDGAAAIMLGSLYEAERLGLKPLGRVMGYVQHAQEPEWFTTAPAFAIEKLLAKHKLTVDDIDLFEVNEAFAVVAMVVAEKVRIPYEKMNVNGGAVALGHPIGMTGARLIVTAMHELHRRNGRYAVCSPCIGGGEATAILIERLG